MATTKPWKARRSDNPSREFGITQEELMLMKPDVLAKIEVDFGQGWQRPARFMEDGSGFLPVAEDDE